MALTFPSGRADFIELPVFEHYGNVTNGEGLFLVGDGGSVSADVSLYIEGHEDYGLELPQPIVPIVLNEFGMHNDSQFAGNTEYFSGVISFGYTNGYFGPRKMQTHHGIIWRETASKRPDFFAVLVDYPQLSMEDKMDIDSLHRGLGTVTVTESAVRFHVTESGNALW